MKIVKDTYVSDLVCSDLNGLAGAFEELAYQIADVVEEHDKEFCGFMSINDIRIKFVPSHKEPRYDRKEHKMFDYTVPEHWELSVDYEYEDDTDERE